MSAIQRALARPARIKPTSVLRQLDPHASRQWHPRLASTSAATPTDISPSLFRRSASFVGKGVFFTALGFIMAAAPAYAAYQQIIRPPSDTETLHLFVPADATAEEAESFINQHPVVAELRANPDMFESRPHMKIPTSFRPSNFTGGTLMGPGRVTVPPFAWADKIGHEYVQICHVGRDLCGHPGLIHGGFLATLLDEGLARCCFAALPHHVGVTASLTVNYRSPAKADTYLILRAETIKVEGRKAWVKGRLETLVGEGEKPTVLAEADALFVSPRQAAVRL